MGGEGRALKEGYRSFKITKIKKCIDIFTPEV